MNGSSCQIIQSGTDYLTATCGEQKPLNDFKAAAEKILLQQRGKGHEIKPTSLLGYVGYKAGSAFAGRRHDGWMVQLSSQTAYEFWRDVAPHATHIARLDAQVTVHLEQEDYDLARKVWLQTTRYKAKHNTKLKIARTQEYEGGATVYLGSKKSDLRARCYDKHAESKDEFYRGCFRYELQARNDVAGFYANQLLASDSDDMPTRSLVHTYFATRGHNPFRTSAGQQQYSWRPEPGSDSKRLAWLSKYCSKTVRQLIANDRLFEVVTALGFSAEELIHAASLIHAQPKKEVN